MTTGETLIVLAIAALLIFLIIWSIRSSKGSKTKPITKLTEEDPWDHVSSEKEDTVRARVVNCPVRELISMTGHTILENEATKPEDERVEVAIMYTIFPDGGLLFSVRSTRDFDASVIAKSWGGGGHKSACGFKGRITDGLPWIVLSEPSVVK